MDRFGGRCACALVALFVALPAYATGGTSVVTPTVRAVQTEFTRLMSQPARLGQMVKFSEDFGPKSPLRYVDKLVKYTPGSIGSLAKGLIKGGVAIYGIQSAISAAGWFIDELTREVMMPGDSGSTCSETHYEESRLTHAEACTLSGLELAILDVMDGRVFNTSADPVDRYGGTPYFVLSDCSVQSPPLIVGYQFFSCTSTYVSGPNEGESSSTSRQVQIKQVSGGSADPASDPVIVSDSEVGGQLFDYADDALFQDLLTDPVTGRPRETQEILDAINDLRRDAVQQQGGDPSTVVDQGPSSGDDAAPSGPPGVGSDSSEFVPPSIPSDSAVPFQDVGEVKSWSSGIGSSGSCPEPFSIPLWDGNSLTISWSPLCTGADYLRPLLIGFGYLSAVYILLGMRRGGA